MVMAKRGDQQDVPTIKTSVSHGTQPFPHRHDGFKTQVVRKDVGEGSIELLTPRQMLTNDLLHIINQEMSRSGIVELPAGAYVTTNDVHAYRIVERVRGGAMSSTYRALHRLTDSATGDENEVFLKILDGNVAPVGSLPPEIHNLEQCRDLEHVVRVHRSHIDLKHEGKLLPPAIVTQWVAGPGLDELLRSPESYSFQEALAIIEQIATGLSGLHQIGILHRDLKPANIKLVPTGSKEPWRKYDVKILDLGIGVKLRDMIVEEHAPEDERFFVGTPFYASPEQILDTRLTTNSDVYSMGVIAAELVLRDVLKGRPLREKTAERLLYASDLSEFTAPHIPRRLLSPDELFAYHYLRRITLEMLRPGPDDRPSADAIKRRLSNRSRTYSRMKITAAAAGGSLVLALGLGTPLLNMYHEQKGAEALAAERLRLELKVYNPARIGKATAAVDRAQEFIKVQEFLESERLCAEAQQTLGEYVANRDTAQMASFAALKRSADLCLAEAFLGQREYVSARVAFARIGRTADDRERIIGREIALNSTDPASHDAVISDLGQVWRGRKSPWAGNRLTEALTFKASQISDKAGRSEQYQAALAHADMMVAVLRPSEVKVDAVGNHILPGDALPGPGQMQELEHALLNRAAVYRRLGQYSPARADIGEALQLAQTLNDRLVFARSLMHLGMIEYHLSNLVSADRAFSNAIQHLRKEGSLGHLAEALSKRGIIRNQRSMPVEAAADAHEAAALYKRFGNERDEILGARYTESLAMLSLGQVGSTIAFSEQAIAHALRHGNVERAGDYANIILEGAWYAGADRRTLDGAYAQAAKHLSGFEETYRNAYADIIYAHGLEETGAADDALNALATAAAKPGYDSYNRGLATALKAVIHAKRGDLSGMEAEMRAIDGLVAENQGVHEVLARLYAAQCIASASQGRPGGEACLSAVKEADATRNLYHAFDVRLDIASARVPAPQRERLKAEVWGVLADGTGLEFVTDAYTGAEFSSIFRRIGGNR